jgi:hypothetical protein
MVVQPACCGKGRKKERKKEREKEGRKEGKNERKRLQCNEKRKGKG